MRFEFYIEDDHAVVSKYKGKNKKVIIPQQYNDFPVTHIADYCFASNKITSVIGKSIKSVGYRAFYYCINLTSVNLPACESIGQSAFYDCTRLTQIDLPACTSIGNGAFWFCKNLTSVNLPSCTSIGYDAFDACSNLIDVNLPACKYIGNDAFYGCTSLTSISLPDCSYISYNAFNSCTNLTYVNLPACTHIGVEAFINCYSLTEINLPVCEYVGDEAFYGCTSLIKKGKYKATEIDLTCRDFHYEIGKWFEEDEAILCKKGFHYVENLYDIFNYYSGNLGEDLRIFEVEAEEISDDHENDSKRVCKKIKLVNEIKSYQEIF